jgi:hypothetical protein
MAADPVEPSMMVAGSSPYGKCRLKTTAHKCWRKIATELVEMTGVSETRTARHLAMLKAEGLVYACVPQMRSAFPSQPSLGSDHGYDGRMALTESCRNALFALALGLLALARAHAQAPLTGDLALWTDTNHPAVRAPTTACDDEGVCAAFWVISEDLQADENSKIDLMGAVVSPSGVTAPVVLRRVSLVGQPIAVGLQKGFALFYDGVDFETGEFSATVLQLFGEDLIPTRPPIPLHYLGTRLATYEGTSSVVRTPGGFALLGISVTSGIGGGAYASLAFVNMAGRLQHSPVQISPPTLGIGVGLAIQPNGDLVAVYSSQTTGIRNDCSQVFARRIAPSGRLLGPAVAVADTACYQIYPAVGVAADGTFLVAWSSIPVNSVTGAFGPKAIVAERFSAQARPPGKPFRVGEGGAPVVAVDPNSHYFVVWEGLDQSSATGDIKGRWLETDGTPITPELTLNTAQDNLDQQFPQVAVASGGVAVVTWQVAVPPSDLSIVASVARVFTTPP